MNELLKKYNITLHLVRHGEYIEDLVGGGWSENHLNENGINQIKALVNNIDNDYDLFISSDLTRAKDSAYIINKKLNMDIIFDPNFREINTGDLTKVNDLDFEYTEKKEVFFKRIEESFKKLLEENKNKKILLLSHSGVISVILYLLNENQDKIPNTGGIVKL